MSRPARGAWIEIIAAWECESWEHGRAPHGARGLKSLKWLRLCLLKRSRPARGAWIEILRHGAVRSFCAVAPRTGRVD